jgi:hypothetical protein
VGESFNMTSTTSTPLIEKENLVESPFVTIILPLDYHGDKTPYRVLDELVAEAKMQLQRMSKSDGIKTIIKKLNRLIVKLPPENLYKGIVAFLSEDVEDIIPLNYEVTEKVMVADNFDFGVVNLLSQNSKEELQVLQEQALVKNEIFKRLVEFRPFGKKTY